MSNRQSLANGLGLLFVGSFPGGCCAIACLLTKSFRARGEDQNAPWDFRLAHFELDRDVSELVAMAT
jgi:hypothetical protein